MQLVCEIDDFRRFEKPIALMAYLGLVPSQRSSGNTIRSGSITKTGNTHAWKVLMSAAWKYIHCPRINVSLRERQKHCSARTVAISQRAQKRLHKRYQALTKRKPPQAAVVALARELVGFLWEAMQAPFRLHEPSIRQNSHGEGSSSKDGEPMCKLFGSGHREPETQDHGSSDEFKY